MLVELLVRDYAVIDDLSLELGGGLSALSGETGAGKSLIVDALSLLLGERASSDVVRVGAEAATIEGRFDISDLPEIAERMGELGMDVADGFLILKRQVAAKGRNRAWINGSPATASVIGELGSALVDLHGQHEHQTLLRRTEQRRILDSFAGATELAEEVHLLHMGVFELRKERDVLEERLEGLEGQSALLQHQLDEIAAAHLEPGEDDRLADEVRRLEHSEELTRDALRMHDRLYGGEGSISEELSGFRKTLEQLSTLDPALVTRRDIVEEVYLSVVELGQEMLAYAEQHEHDPARLDEARERQDLLFRLMRKYGPTLPEVLEAESNLKNELDGLGGSSLSMKEMDREIAARTEELDSAAGELSGLRQAAADRLSEEVEEILPGLGMPEGAFQVAVTELPETGPGGNEDVDFRVTVNSGFDPMPLSVIASGGEISRVMLALKAILAKVDRVPTLVFDEIDVGIGGVVAGKVADELLRVAEGHQVFVVTHLAQIAAGAHHHFYVEKDDGEGVAVARVSEVEGEDRISEIARMLSGNPKSANSRRHARELLGLPPALEPLPDQREEEQEEVAAEPEPVEEEELAVVVEEEPVEEVVAEEEEEEEELAVVVEEEPVEEAVAEEEEEEELAVVAEEEELVVEEEEAPSAPPDPSEDS